MEELKEAWKESGWFMRGFMVFVALYITIAPTILIYSTGWQSGFSQACEAEGGVAVNRYCIDKAAIHFLDD